MQDLWNQVSDMVVGKVPQLVGALAILVVGWLVALVMAAVVRGAMRRTGLGDRIGLWIRGNEPGREIDVPRTTGKATFYILMLLVLVGFLQVLGLTIVTEPINDFLGRLFEFLPRLLGAVVLLVVAWFVATGLRLVVSRGLSATGVDDRVAATTGRDGAAVPLSKTLGDVAYWLVFLIFLPAILGALALHGLLDPVRSMTAQVLGFLPNVAGAALIMVVGWFVAKIVRRIVAGLLSAAGADRLGEGVGLSTAAGGTGLSGLLAVVVYVMILVPVAVSALGALELEAITGPASHMLDVLWGALPSVFGALLVLAFSYGVGRIVSNFVSGVLQGAGFNRVAVRLRLAREATEGAWSPSGLVGRLILLVIMLFAFTEALNMLGFEAVGELVAEVLAFTGQVILGLVIFAVGLYLSYMIADTIRASGLTHAPVLATAARTAILLLVGAMALRRMGLANEIIQLAFALVLGAAAVAFAIAFGVGGREYAARQIDRWRGSAGTPAGGGRESR
ncbi:MAG: mechanosensitive ion channel [Candidatus Eisenbacteria bacterium]